MTIEVPTFEELYDAGRAETESRNSALTDWNEGSNLDALTGAGAIQADEVIRIGIDLFMAHFVDTAEGSQLDSLALDRFGLTRKAAGAAVGTVRITMSSTDPVVIPIGTSFSGTVNGTSVQVISTAEAQNNAVGSALVDVICEASATGLTGNFAAASIDTIDDDIGDSDATCTNLDRFAGGRDAETDEQFRDRIRRYFQTVQRGTVDALIFGARQVPGVEFAAVDESNMELVNGGYTLVVVGDINGTGNDVLTGLVEAELENWRAAGVEVIVSSSEREVIDATIAVRVRRGADVTALASAIRAAVVAHSESLDPGETWYRSASAAAVFDVSDDILDVECTTPTDDYTPSAAYNAVRVESASLNVSFVEV